MKKLNAPFKADIIGSFLRPQYLKDARTDFIDEKISKEELKALEDKAIEELIKKMVDHDYKVVTDGEYRRGFYHSDFQGGLNGINCYTYKMNLFGKDTVVASTKVEGKISWNKNHPFLEHFKYGKKIADKYSVAYKFDIPGPNMIILDTLTAKEENYYIGRHDELIKDLIDTYSDCIRDLYDLGARYIQLDDPVWVSLCDKGFQSKITGNGFTISYARELFYKATKGIVESIPEDLAITTHMCQGNLLSRKFYDAQYDGIAETVFSIPFDGFFMEFDDDKYCNFKLLKFLGKNQRIVLGIVSTQSDVMEDKNVLRERIRKASEFVDIKNICLSTQCGFAASADGNFITEESEYKKLDLLKDLAVEMLGDER